MGSEGAAIAVALGSELVTLQSKAAEVKKKVRKKRNKSVDGVLM